MSRVNLGLHQSDVSVAWDLGPHDFSILRYWLDETPSTVSAIEPRLRDSRRSPTSRSSTSSTPRGTIAHVELSWLAPSKLRRTTIVGSREDVVYDDTSNEPVRVFDSGVHAAGPETFGEYQLSYRTGDIVSPARPARRAAAARDGRLLRRDPPGQTAAIVRRSSDSRWSGSIEAVDESLALRRCARTAQTSRPTRSLPRKDEKGMSGRSAATSPLPENVLGRRLRGRTQRQKPVDLGPPARLGPVRHVELAVDVRQVELDRLLGHPEHPRELRVRVALGDELEDLELAPRQVMSRQ